MNTNTTALDKRDQCTNLFYHHIDSLHGRNFVCSTSYNVYIVSDIYLTGKDHRFISCGSPKLTYIYRNRIST